MSVTNSNAKSAVKTSRKAKNAASASNTVLSAVLAQTEEQHVPLSALVKSPQNVRIVPYSAESVRELADFIKGIGLLQNLVVHALPDGLYGVAAGGRRLAAMNLLTTENTIHPDWPVRVKVVPDNLATAASLTENGQHLEMHPAEQIAGFRAMAAEGKTPAQTGDLLGYSPRHVQRMLKLAGLAPVILEALAADKITTEHCQALALEDNPDRQVQVYEAACREGWNNKPEVRVIRNLITDSQVSTLNNSKYTFVGEKAFSGDEIRADLFSDEQGGFVDKLALDTALLEKLQWVAECLKEAEGWAWCAGRMEPVSRYGEDTEVYRIQDEPDAVYTEQEQQRLDELQELYDENQTASDETDTMESEIEAIECAAQLRAWTLEMRAQSGVVVSWRHGEICVQRGVSLREQTETEDEPAQVPVYERQPEPVDEISVPLLTRMCAERTLSVQAALMQQPEKSLALLAWTLCLNVFSSGAYNRPAQISLNCKHYSLTKDAPSGESGVAFVTLSQEGKRLETLLPDGWTQDFTTFFTLSTKGLTALLSFCTACSLDGMQMRGAGGTTRSPLDKLEIALAFHLRDWWQPTKADFFTGLKKPQIIAALNEAGLTGAARDAEKMKKGDAAELAEDKMRDNRWVPVWMRAPDAENDVSDTENGSADADSHHTLPDAA
ncbi:chromosome partitioning protein ParB [Salmonella enterica subsp. enterica]|uniref:ParB/RepB/Spo0J family partition protein n=1 Tax=Salmonella enterica TaxID=28901 RepID=UPI000FAE714F|nr:ParB/RepB/Spo0J family partition protein [Salmonella enterica]EBR0194923.1 chromosome partitioning protein ParB [Salmonella enterica subsp. enterica serovar Mikawasima]EBU9523990.1 chromosome partitioning protein ParB [Salmonella enterica subsp. enterica serovar Mikawasima]EBV5034568.1 chromosome partitioning protein ParB [Salmonella enterica subsp. enterica serovar Mikawasima]EBX4920244.1 chromosome partitioning protein ParB [Salmonella enterica subsp. enterica serovar Mikawasima]ECG589433